MAKSSRTISGSKESPKLRPLLSDEARENRAISLAMDRAEEQLVNGTASSQIILHYLKLGTAKANLEREKLARENELLRAKTEAINRGDQMESLYKDALNAMRRYGGNRREEEDDYDEY